MTADPSTPIAIGTRIGPYEIVGWLGAGGMGEVYRARDPRLGREVALKLIAGTVATDSNRLHRFEQEARAAGQINHPNILAVYDVGVHAGAPYIVAELLDGESLRRRLQQGAVPARKAIDYACQMAHGLAAAHDRNIVHRDVKPDNVFITNDGRIKILDFGVAKLTRPADDAASHAGLTTETDPGTIVGTSGYMSPEQVRGEAVDARSDIFGVGTILYEMLTGRAAFTRRTAPETMAAILMEEPPAPLSSAVPPTLSRIVARCLEKTREARFQSARDLAFALEVLPEFPATGTTAAAADLRWLRHRAVPWVVAAMLAVALAGTLAWKFTQPSPQPAVTRLSLIVPGLQAMAGNRHNVDLSPDGAQIVYVAANRLYVRSLSALDAEPIQGTEEYQQVDEPAFSPDGRSIVFYALGDRTIKRIAVAGGAAVTLCQADDPLGLSWGPGGILAGQGKKGIVRVPPNGGTPDTIVRVEDGELAHGPQMLPGGRHVLFTLATGAGPDKWDTARIVVASLASGDRKTIIEGGSDARYVPTGHLVYARSGIMFAVAFDLQRLEVRGDAVPIVEGVSRGTAGATGTANFSFSSNGSLVYMPGPVSASSALLALIDRGGAVEPLHLAPGSYWWPRISPDGARIAFGIDDGKEAAIWLYDLAGTSAPRRLTFGGHNRFPTWTSDSKRVGFQSDREGDLGIFWQSADGAGAAERLTTPAKGESHAPDSWSPKADTLLFSVTKEPEVSLWTLSIRDRRVTPFGGVHSSKSVSTAAVFSPDGTWVAYTSNQSGTPTIYVQPFPATGATYQLFARGSDDPHHPVWSPDGKELFYIARPGAFESVSVTTRPTFAFGNPKGLPGPFLLGQPAWRRSYDITPGGKILGVIPGLAGPALSGTAAPQIQVVLNWYEELKARVP